MQKEPKKLQLVASRTYVLPPRLKPGRKPKAGRPESRSGTPQTGGDARGTNWNAHASPVNGNSRQNGQITAGGQNGNGYGYNINGRTLQPAPVIRSSRPELAPKPVAHTATRSVRPVQPVQPANKGQPGATAGPAAGPGATATSAPVSIVPNGQAHSHDPDDNCGLCERDDCVCADLGLRNDKGPIARGEAPPPAPPAPSAPSAAIAMDASGAPAGVQFDFAPVKAVPLRRPTSGAATPGSRPIKRFKRLAPEPSPHASGALPSPQTPSRSAAARNVPSDLSQPPSLQQSPIKDPATRRPKDPCGFCSHDTPCLCAGDTDDPKPDVKPEPAATSKQNRVTTHDCGLCPGDGACVCKPGPQQAALTPAPQIRGPPSQTPAKMAAPGSCDRCSQDAMCALFCVSVGTCAMPLPPQLPTLQCSQAYDVVSRHPKFSTIDLGGFVQRLEAASDGRVSVRSVASALRLLDA